jgi:hypothetical protein
MLLLSPENVSGIQLQDEKKGVFVPGPVTPGS